MRILICLAIATGLYAQDVPVAGAFLGAFKQGAGPVSSTVGGFAGYSFAKTFAGLTPYSAGLWTQRGSLVSAGVLKELGSVGKFTAFCTATAGMASEITSGLAGTASCFATYHLQEKLDIGAGAAVFGANVSGYDFGGRRVVPGFFMRFHQ